MSRYWVFFLVSSAIVGLLFSIPGILSEKNEPVMIYKNGKDYRIYSDLSQNDLERIKKNPGWKIILGEKINVNSASIEELDSLPGISRKVALNIVKYREIHGPFREVNDLLNVKGIKEKRLKMIKPFIEIR